MKFAEAIRRAVLPALLLSVSPAAFPDAGEAAAPIEIGATRLIYDADAPSASLPVTNRTDRPIFVTVEPGAFRGVGRAAEPNDDFMASPAARILEAGETAYFRIVRLAENLPQDRESLYLVNVKIVPASDPNAARAAKGSAAKLALTFNGTLKLFWRPPEIAHAFGSAEARMRITAECSRAALTLRNPTPFWVTFASIEADGKPLVSSSPLPMAAPGGEVRLPVEACPKEASFSLIGDTGRRTLPERLALEPAS